MFSFLCDTAYLSSAIPLISPLVAHCSGAALIPETQTVLIADTHLGYGWAQRRRGELGPLADETTRQKLLAFLEQVAPKRIVFLGDLVHAPRPCAEEREWIERLLCDLSSRAELISVRGNHDRAFAREFPHLPVRTMDRWCEGGCIAVHGDRLPDTLPDGHMLVMGHLHPALPIRDAAGAAQKLPVFLANSTCVLLPAFSPFAGGYDLLCGLPDQLLPLFGNEPIRAVACTGKRVADLGHLDQLIERTLQQERGTPGQFRRRLARGHSTKSGR